VVWFPQMDFFSGQERNLLGDESFAIDVQVTSGLVELQYKLLISLSQQAYIVEGLLVELFKD